VSLAIPLSGYYDAVLDLLAGHIGQGGAFLGEPLAVTDEDGAARPYAALYPSPGNRRSVSLSGPSDAEPRVVGLCTGPLSEPDGYDPGPVRHDTALTPSRHYSPLLWTGLIWLPEGGTP
jgi:hypothetical protein